MTVRKLALGDDYYRLQARAYLPVCESNRDIILAIDSGIIKEVSVGCAVGRVCAMCAVRTSRCVLTKRARFTAQSFVAVNL